MPTQNKNWYYIAGTEDGPDLRLGMEPSEHEEDDLLGWVSLQQHEIPTLIAALQEACERDD